MILAISGYIARSADQSLGDWLALRFQGNLRKYRQWKVHPRADQAIRRAAGPELRAGLRIHLERSASDPSFPRTRRERGNPEPQVSAAALDPRFREGDE